MDQNKCMPDLLEAPAGYKCVQWTPATQSGKGKTSPLEQTVIHMLSVIVSWGDFWWNEIQQAFVSLRSKRIILMTWVAPDVFRNLCIWYVCTLGTCAVAWKQEIRQMGLISFIWQKRVAGKSGSCWLKFQIYYQLSNQPLFVGEMSLTHVFLSKK